MEKQIALVIAIVFGYAALLGVIALCIAICYCSRCCMRIKGKAQMARGEALRTKKTVVDYETKSPELVHFGKNEENDRRIEYYEDIKQRIQHEAVENSLFEDGSQFYEVYYKLKKIIYISERNMGRVLREHGTWSTIAYDAFLDETRLAISYMDSEFMKMSQNSKQCYYEIDSSKLQYCICKFVYPLKQLSSMIARMKSGMRSELEFLREVVYLLYKGDKCSLYVDAAFKAIDAIDEYSVDNLNATYDAATKKMSCVRKSLADEDVLRFFRLLYESLSSKMEGYAGAGIITEMDENNEIQREIMDKINNSSKVQGGLHHLVRASVVCSGIDNRLSTIFKMMEVSEKDMDTVVKDCYVKKCQVEKVGHILYSECKKIGKKVDITLEPRNAKCATVVSKKMNELEEGNKVARHRGKK